LIASVDSLGDELHVRLEQRLEQLNPFQERHPDVIWAVQKFGPDDPDPDETIAAVAEMV